MTTFPDIEATNSPRYVGVREDELPFQFDWTAQGTPSAVTGVYCYDRTGTAVTGAVVGTPSLSGDNVQGFTVDCTKLTANTEYYLTCIVTIGGKERGMFCRIIAKPFP